MTEQEIKNLIEIIEERRLLFADDKNELTDAQLKQIIAALQCFITDRL